MPYTPGSPIYGFKNKLRGLFTKMSDSPDSGSTHVPKITTKNPLRRKKIYYNYKSDSSYIYLSMRDRDGNKEHQFVPQYSAVSAEMISLIVSPRVTIPKTRAMITGQADGTFRVSGTLSKEIPGFKPAFDGFNLNIISKRDFASLLVASYFIEENDLHNGNWGFDRFDYPTRLDFDQTWSSQTAYLKEFSPETESLEEIKDFNNSIFSRENAFEITTDDLNNFPLLDHCRPYNWLHIGSSGNKIYQEKVHELSQSEEFIKWKWFYFTKTLLIMDRQIEYICSAHCSSPDFCSLLIMHLKDRRDDLKAALAFSDSYREYLDNISEADLELLNREFSQYDLKYLFKYNITYPTNEQNFYQPLAVRSKYRTIAFQVSNNDVLACIKNLKTEMDSDKFKEQALINQILAKITVFKETQHAILVYQDLRKDVDTEEEITTRSIDRVTEYATTDETQADHTSETTQASHDFINSQTDKLSEISVELTQSLKTLSRELIKLNPRIGIKLTTQIIEELNLDIDDEFDQYDLAYLNFTIARAYLTLNDYNSASSIISRLTCMTRFYEDNNLEISIALAKCYFELNNYQEFVTTLSTIKDTRPLATEIEACNNKLSILSTTVSRDVYLPLKRRINFEIQKLDRLVNRVNTDQEHMPPRKRACL